MATTYDSLTKSADAANAHWAADAFRAITGFFVVLAAAKRAAAAAEMNRRPTPRDLQILGIESWR